MLAANHATDTQAITTQSIIVADILRILAISAPHTSEEPRLAKLADVSAELRQLVIVGGNADTLYACALQGITLAQSAIRAQTRAGGASGGSLGSWLVWAVARTVPRVGRGARSSSQEDRTDIALLRARSAQLLDRLTKVRRDLILVDHGVGTGVRRRARREREKQMESSLAG